MHGYYNGYSACSASSPPAQHPSGPTAKTAYAYKYWWAYPDGRTAVCVIPDTPLWRNPPPHLLTADCARAAGDGYEWSNDPSFQFGFKQAGYAMGSWFQGTGWRPSESDAALPYYNEDIDICHNPKANTFYTDVKPIGHVINATSCIDGYVQGFKHWCSTYTKDCLYATESGMIPLQLLTSSKNRFYGKDLNRVRGYFRPRRKLGMKKAIDTIKKIGNHEKRIISRQIVNRAKESNALITIGDIEHPRRHNSNRKFNRKLASFQYHRLTHYI